MQIVDFPIRVSFIMNIMQFSSYSDFVSDVKNENVQLKKFGIFLIFAQNIDCGYMLEPPGRGGSTSTHNLCF